MGGGESDWIDKASPAASSSGVEVRPRALSGRREPFISGEKELKE